MLRRQPVVFSIRRTRLSSALLGWDELVAEGAEPEPGRE